MEYGYKVGDIRDSIHLGNIRFPHVGASLASTIYKIKIVGIVETPLGRDYLPMRGGDDSNF